MTDIEDDVSYMCTSTTDMQSRSHGDLGHFIPPLETGTSHNQLESLTPSADEFEVRCIDFLFQ